MRVTDSFLPKNYLISLLAMQDKKNDKTRISDSKRDNYISGENNVYEIYGNKAEENGKYSQTILDAINFGYRNIEIEEGETSFYIGNVNYLKKDIPAINIRQCLEIKAVNNKVTFTNGKYYRFKDSSGIYRAVTCRYDGIGQPYSELAAKKANDASYRFSQFWNLLAWDGTYIGLYYSRAEERQMLNDAGITEGFFSVEVGSNKQEYFYSNGISGAAVRKFEYDETYNMFINPRGVLDEYDAGSVFIIGGNEYILSEDKKLDIPYGEDVCDVKYPPKSSKSADNL
ncbi:MAG: hypothetical protein K2M78_05815 [Lachnospiraceae bacterium]|nr:hypothetical protein [Lachnospiraceae bacterium]